VQIEKAFQISSELWDIPVGSRVGVSVNEKRKVLFYIDGVHQGSIDSDTDGTVLLYPVFHLVGPFKQVMCAVTLLGLVDNGNSYDAR
jgi:hypothetical protein